VNVEPGPDTTLGTQLYAASRYHARRARALAETTDAFERIDAAAHAGSAVELIAKALLADLDVRLLPDRDQHHALLDAVAVLARRVEPVVARRLSLKTTVGARVAVELAARLVPGCRQHESAAHRVAKVRNGAVHMAQSPSAEELGDVIEAMQDFTDAAARQLRGSSRDYWGVFFDDVQQQRKASKEALLAHAREKVAQAKSRFDEMVGRLSAELRAPVLAELQTREGLTGDETDEVACPACEQAATAAWDWDADAEPDGDGDYTLTAFLALVGLGCPVCGLRLDANEVDALGIELELAERDPAEDFDDRVQYL
jgi:uncharacterized protein YjbJ (UPF0337 family)